MRNKNIKMRPQILSKSEFNPDYALEFTGIGLPVENTLTSLQRLHSLAFGFETFAFWQKTELSRLSTVFQGNPIPVLTKYLGSITSGLRSPPE
jgi:hypothetical protein